MVDAVKIQLCPKDIERIEEFLSDRFNMSYAAIQDKYGFTHNRDPHKLSTYLRRMGIDCPDMRELNTRERRAAKLTCSDNQALAKLRSVMK